MGYIQSSCWSKGHHEKLKTTHCAIKTLQYFPQTNGKALLLKPIPIQPINMKKPVDAYLEPSPL